MKTITITAGVLILSTMVASASQIERACNTSERSTANRTLCGCIQDAADLTLSRGDQKRAAKFFKNPQKAQDTRQASNGNREDFWDRYKRFGETAQEFCTAPS
jgi:hypothetical protein